MIFSRLFIPKWKSKKVEQRLLAISQLDKSSSAQQQILNQLAKNDADDKVRIAALKRINDLGMWWQVYQEDHKANIGKVAENEILISPDVSSLTQQQLTQLTNRVQKKANLISLLPLIVDIDKKISLLKKINQKQQIIAVFKESDEAIQLALMPLMTQYGLQKTIEKYGYDSLKIRLKEQVEAEKSAKTKPLEVLQEAKLILAKLNALRDKHDFESCKKQHDLLLKQWNSLDLSWLTEPQEQTRKFAEVSEKLEHHLTQLKQTFDKNQRIAKQAELITNAKQNCLSLEEQLEKHFSKIILQPEETTLTNFRLVLNKFVAATQELELSGENTQIFDKKIAVLNDQIQKIEVILPDISTITELIAQGKDLPVAQDLASFDHAYDVYRNWNDNLTQMITSLPEPIKVSLIKEIKAISSKWKAQHRELANQAKDLKNSLAKQLNDIKRLLNAGRFNVCFGLFKGIQSDYLTLPLSKQQKLSRDYDEIALKLDEVSDWQKQISLPKRHELLTEIAIKLTEENIDIHARSEWIKLTRKRWNELGYISTEEEKQLDSQFNQQLELAFSPCRKFYAEQEQKRAKNVEKRQALISQYQLLSGSLDHSDVSEVEKQYFRLKQLWRDAGEVDNQQFKSLSKQLKSIESQIKSHIKACQQTHAEQKSQLIEQAKKALNEDSIDNTIERLKSLQSKWKTVGFASKKVETKLWQEFRAINDVAFAKRDESRKALASEQQALLDTLTTRFKAIIERQTANSIADIQRTKASLEELDNEIKKYQIKSSLLGQIAKHIEQLNKQVEMFNNDKHSAKFEALFTSLEQREIPSEWVQPSEVLINRHRATIRLEITNELVSPDSDSALRLEEQVSLLQDKVKGNTNSNLELLKIWLSDGEIDEQSLRLLARIKPVFCGDN